MNQYKVEKKKFINTCKLALKRLETEQLEAMERGHFMIVNDIKEKQSKINTILKLTEMPFVSEVLLSEDAMMTLNYCLTKR